MNPFRPLVALLLAAVLTTPSATAATPAPAANPRADADADGLAVELAALRAEATAVRAELEALRAAVAGGALAASVTALDQRVARLDAALGAYGERLAALEEQDAGQEDILASLEDQQARANHLAVYGSLLFRDEAGPTSAFDAEAIELVISGRPHPRLGVFAEIELERAAAVGGERGGEVIVEQAWASYAFSPALSLRGGVLLVPFGAVNTDHYAPTRDVISKPLPAVAVSPADWTDNGLGLFGRTVLGGSWVLAYDALLGAGLGAELGTTGLRDARQPFGEDNNADRAVALRTALRHGDRFELGLSAYRGAWDDDARHELTGWAADLSVGLGPLTLRGDYETLRAERPLGADADYRGWYARGVWRLAGGLLRRGWHGKAFPDANVELVAQWDEAEVAGPSIDPLAAPLLHSREQRRILGINYRPTRLWVLKVDHEHSHGRGLPLVRGSSDAWLAALGFVF